MILTSDDVQDDLLAFLMAIGFLDLPATAEQQIAVSVLLSIVEEALESQRSADRRQFIEMELTALECVRADTLARLLRQLDFPQ